MAETVKKTLDINKELLDWLDSNYPGTSFTWIINNCLESLKKAHEENPVDYFAIGAKYLKEKIQDGS